MQEGWRRGCPTLLQSRWPSRQRQLLQSSTQELPCGKDTPRDQQGLVNMTTVVRRRRLRQSIQTLEGGSGPRPDHDHSRPTFLASGSRTTWWAATAVPIDLIHARGSVGTGVGLALIDVCKENGCVLRAVHPTQGQRVSKAGAGRLYLRPPDPQLPRLSLCQSEAF